MQRSQPDNPEVLPILVLGNKIDLEEERKVTRDQAEQFCQE